MNKYSDSKFFVNKTFQLFSEELYSKSGVVDACKCLRDKYQVNVNLIFFCCWLASQNYQQISDLNIQEIIDRITPWHENVVEPLKSFCESIQKNQGNNDYAFQIHDLIKNNKKFAEEAERSLIMQCVNDLRRAPQNLGGEESQALNNILNYINNQKIKLHKNDLEKIYRIVKVSGSSD